MRAFVRSLVRAHSDIGCTCNVTFIVQGWPMKGCRTFHFIDFLFEFLPEFLQFERGVPAQDFMNLEKHTSSSIYRS